MMLNGNVSVFEAAKVELRAALSLPHTHADQQSANRKPYPRRASNSGARRLMAKYLYTNTTLRST
jgi:hypothetical protein